HGIAFGSGLAAIEAIIKLLKSGDEVLVSDDLYGGTYRLFTKVLVSYGIKFRFINMKDAAVIEKEVGESTKMLWVETPTNPLMHVTDIEACAAIAKKHDLLLSVDNTFASPYLQNPLDWGADLVVHSATKYLGGHSDVVLGAVVVKDDELAERLLFIQNSCGAIPGPHDSWLVLRGIKTLHVRMKQHCKNGEKIAYFLKEQSKVDQVNWCGFPDHPNHEIAK